jgi:hypothetical protein
MIHLLDGDPAPRTAGFVLLTLAYRAVTALLDARHRAAVRRRESRNDIVTHHTTGMVCLGIFLVARARPSSAVTTSAGRCDAGRTAT